MANNSPTNLAKGGEKETKTVEDMLSPQKKEEHEQEKSADVNKQPLNAESTEPQTDALAQPAADLALEQSRGRVFGDLTSSNGDSNTRGLHGRDGGVVPEGPSNPVPSDAAIEPTPPEQPADPVANAENKDTGE